jgi:hypothetical protein
MRLIYICILLFGLSACSILWNNKTIKTFDFSGTKITYNYYNLMHYGTCSRSEFPDGILYSASYAKEEWLFFIEAFGNYKAGIDKESFQKTKLKSFINFYPKHLIRDTIALSGQLGTMYSFYKIDSTMGEGNYFKVRNFFLKDRDFTLEVSISKYHYTPADDTTFQKIIDGIEIIRE